MREQFEATPVNILLVEDSEGDARLTKEVMRDSKIRNTIHHVLDGVEAMAFLHKQGKYAQVPRPDLILLDLNLPRKDGREVLAEIKKEKKFLQIPIVIMTVSDDEADVLKTYDLHANCYIVKPIGLIQFLKVVRSIEDFWLTIVKLPSGTRQPLAELPGARR